MYWHARREPLPPRTKLSRDVVRRVWGFARDFRWQIAGYLFLLALSSLAAVVPALLVRELLNTAIPQRSFSLVNLIGLAAVGVALANAGLALGQRVLSSRIGEGLIYRLRTSLFDHVQRQPLAFFTHTQTGALTSRLNNDVVGAQRALTGTLGSVFSNLISLVTTLVTMFLLNWRITLIAVAVLPLFLLPARRVQAPAPGHHPRVDAAQRGHEHHHERALQRRRGVAGAVRPPRPGAQGLRRQGRGVRDIEVRSAIYGQTFFVVLGLVGAVGLTAIYWLGARQVLQGQLQAGVVWSPWPPWSPRSTAPHGPDQRPRVDVMTAFVSFERVFEVLDFESPIRDQPEQTPLTSPPGGSSSTTSASATRPPRSRPSPASPAGRPRSRPPPASRSCTMSASPSSPASWSPWSARRGRARPPPPCWSPGSTTSARRRPGRRGRRARPGAGEPAGRDRPGRPGPAPVPRDHPGQPALRQAGRDPGGDRGRLPRRPDPRPGDREPARAVGDLGRERGYRRIRAGRSSAWPSAGCCWPTPRS